MEAVSAFQMYKGTKGKSSSTLKTIKKPKRAMKKKNLFGSLDGKLDFALRNSTLGETCSVVVVQNVGNKQDNEASLSKLKSIKKRAHIKAPNSNVLLEQTVRHSDSDKECKKTEIVPLTETAITKPSKDCDKLVKTKVEPQGNYKKVKKQLVQNAGRSKMKNHDSSSEPSTENAFHCGEDIFKYLISPTSIVEFFNSYWEKAPLFVSRKNAEYYTSIISSEKLDHIVRNNSLHYTKNIDVVTYENGKRETMNAEGRAIPSALWDFYANGCSIRVLNPQSYSQKLHTMISTLQEYFGNMVGANLYLTPPGSQGFAPHYDDIEAFILQIEGRKHWKLYQPLTENEVLPRYSSKNLERSELGKPFMELTLNAGDFLYFPRGIIHEASTDEDLHSMHITVSVYQQTSYVDLFEHILPAALKEASQQDVDFRQGLPLNYLRELGAVNQFKRNNARKEMLSKIEILFDKLKKYMAVDNAADQLGRKFMYDSMPPVLLDNEKSRTCREDGEHLVNGRLTHRIEFDLDTEVRLLRYHCLRLVLENGSAKLYYNTENGKVYHSEEEQVLEIEESNAIIVKKLQNLYPAYIKITELPLEDEMVKLQVISDLWERGLVVTKEPLNRID